MGFTQPPHVFLLGFLGTILTIPYKGVAHTNVRILFWSVLPALGPHQLIVLVGKFTERPPWEVVAQARTGIGVGDRGYALFYPCLPGKRSVRVSSPHAPFWEPSQSRCAAVGGGGLLPDRRPAGVPRPQPGPRPRAGGAAAVPAGGRGAGVGGGRPQRHLGGQPAPPPGGRPVGLLRGAPGHSLPPEVRPSLASFHKRKQLGIPVTLCIGRRASMKNVCRLHWLVGVQLQLPLHTEFFLPSPLHSDGSDPQGGESFQPPPPIVGLWGG